MVVYLLLYGEPAGRLSAVLVSNSLCNHGSPTLFRVNRIRLGVSCHCFPFSRFRQFSVARETHLRHARVVRGPDDRAGGRLRLVHSYLRVKHPLFTPQLAIFRRTIVNPNTRDRIEHLARRGGTQKIRPRGSDNPRLLPTPSRDCRSSRDLRSWPHGEGIRLVRLECKTLSGRLLALKAGATRVHPVGERSTV
jgi:hypothetical protein